MSVHVCACLHMIKIVKIEKMKINVCFLQAYFNDTNRLMQELVNDSKKIVKCMED